MNAISNNDQEKRDELRDKLTEAVTSAMGQNDLDNQQQIEVLAEMFLNVLRLYGEFNGEEPAAFAENCLGQMLKINNPDTRWRELPEHVANFDFGQLAEFAKKMKGFPADADAVHHAASMYFRRNEGNGGKHGGGRIVQPDENNSWLKVFPAPLTSDKMIDYLMLQMGHEFDAQRLPSKMQGVLLTSMPESDKEFFKRHLKTLGVTVVSRADDHRLRYVVFGAGMQASTKTEQIRDRIAHNEIIEGIYYEEFFEVITELDYLNEGGEA